MATISAKRVYGRSIADPAISGNGGAIARCVLDFEGRPGVGDVQYEIVASGYLNEVFANPDGSVAPDSGWSVTITDESGDTVYAIASVDDADSTHRESIGLALSGTYYVTIAGLGTSTLGRGKVALVLVDEVNIINTGGLEDGDYGGASISGSGTVITPKPSGSDTQIQFNDSGAFGGDAGLTYDKTTDTLSVVRVALDPTPDSDHTFSGPSATMTAGEDLVFPEVVYIKSDGKLGKADASAAATAPVFAMASATIANNASGVFILPGSFVRDDTWNWTVGGAIYLDLTSGALTQTAPSSTDEVVQVIGRATHADRMFFNPSPDFITIV